MSKKVSTRQLVIGSCLLLSLVIINFGSPNQVNASENLKKSSANNNLAGLSTNKTALLVNQDEIKAGINKNYQSAESIEKNKEIADLHLSEKQNYHNNWYLFAGCGMFALLAFVMAISSKRLRRRLNQTEEASQQLIWQQINFDPLTNLPNRRMFLEHLQHAIKKSDSNTLPLALLFLDLDQFKHVNDSLGHALGDNLLAEVAQRITSCVRESDIVARLGGDEFTIILSNVKNLRCVERISLDVLRKIADPFYVDERALYLSASIGIAIYPNDGKEIDILLKQADQAMYAAKNLGGNRYQFFTLALQETAETKVRIINDLRSALIDDQFQLYYQPIVELSTNKVFKAEALIRWIHPINGIINPCQFIHIAEKTNMIAAIGDWVFRNAAQYTKQLRLLNPDFQMSINVSPLQFENNSKATKWISHLNKLGIPAESITIEITEGLLLDLTEAVKQQLTQYREAGIEMAIDDFGTGYSSLAYLKKFDIDYIKIDRAFVNNLAVENSDMVLCEAIIDMAHKLGFKVIAEGVETEAQLALLKQAGCDFGQGYLFSKPIPELEFNQYLNSLSTQYA